MLDAFPQKAKIVLPFPMISTEDINQSLCDLEKELRAEDRICCGFLPEYVFSSIMLNHGALPEQVEDLVAQFGYAQTIPNRVEDPEESRERPSRLRKKAVQINEWEKVVNYVLLLEYLHMMAKTSHPSTARSPRTASQPFSAASKWEGSGQPPIQVPLHEIRDATNCTNDVDHLIQRTEETEQPVEEFGPSPTEIAKAIACARSSTVKKDTTVLPSNNWRVVASSVCPAPKYLQDSWKSRLLRDAEVNKPCSIPKPPVPESLSASSSEVHTIALETPVPHVAAESMNNFTGTSDNGKAKVAPQKSEKAGAEQTEERLLTPSKKPQLRTPSSLAASDASNDQVHPKDFSLDSSSIDLNLVPTKLISLRQVFFLIDTSKKGWLSTLQVQKALRSRGVLISRFELEAVAESLGLRPVGADTRKERKVIDSFTPSQKGYGHALLHCSPVKSPGKRGTENGKRGNTSSAPVIQLSLVDFCLVVSRLRPQVIKEIRRAELWRDDDSVSSIKKQMLLSHHEVKVGAQMVPTHQVLCRAYPSSKEERSGTECSTDNSETAGWPHRCPLSLSSPSRSHSPVRGDKRQEREVSETDHNAAGSSPLFGKLQKAEEKREIKYTQEAEDGEATNSLSPPSRLPFERINSGIGLKKKDPSSTKQAWATKRERTKTGGLPDHALKVSATKSSYSSKQCVGQSAAVKRFVKRAPLSATDQVAAAKSIESISERNENFTVQFAELEQMWDLLNKDRGAASAGSSTTPPKDEKNTSLAARSVSPVMSLQYPFDTNEAVEPTQQALRGESVDLSAITLSEPSFVCSPSPSPPMIQSGLNGGKASRISSDSAVIKAEGSVLMSEFRSSPTSSHPFPLSSSPVLTGDGPSVAAARPSLTPRSSISPSVISSMPAVSTCQRSSSVRRSASRGVTLPQELTSKLRGYYPAVLQACVKMDPKETNYVTASQLSQALLSACPELLATEVDAVVGLCLCEEKDSQTAGNSLCQYVKLIGDLLLNESYTNLSLQIPMRGREPFSNASSCSVSRSAASPLPTREGGRQSPFKEASPLPENPGSSPNHRYPLATRIQTLNTDNSDDKVSRKVDPNSLPLTLSDPELLDAENEMPCLQQLPTPPSNFSEKVLIPEASDGDALQALRGSRSHSHSTSAEWRLSSRELEHRDIEDLEEKTRGLLRAAFQAVLPGEICAQTWKDAFHTNEVLGWMPKVDFVEALQALFYRRTGRAAPQWVEDQALRIAGNVPSMDCISGGSEPDFYHSERLLLFLQRKSLAEPWPSQESDSKNMIPAIQNAAPDEPSEFNTRLLLS